MRPNEVPFEHAFAIEKAIRTELALQGLAPIPATDFSGRNGRHAPMTYQLVDGAPAPRREAAR
jgi:hypothetical protein